MVGQWNSADVHAQQAGNDVDGQRHDRDHGEQEKTAIRLLGGVTLAGLLITSGCLIYLQAAKTIL